MTPPGRGARSTRLALAGTLVAVSCAFSVPELRSPVVVVASVASVALVLLGVHLHRPVSAAWYLVAVMLGLWAAATVLVQLQGGISTPAVVLVRGGQAVAVALVVHVVLAGARRGRAAALPGSRIDVVIIATVLGLVSGQLVAAGTAGGGGLAALVGPTVDVAVLGMLLRFVVTRRRLRRSSWLALCGAVLTSLYDLLSSVQQQEVALPGEPAQVLGALGVLLLGIAALHPSMTVAFAPETLPSRRTPSASLLGLLPLVAVPVGLWWVAEATDAPGLPTLVLLLAGAAVAGLSLLRAAAALRASEHMAEHDPLTDLANRRGLDRAFTDTAHGRGHSLLLVDIDEFKQVNDTHGHDVGDQLLLRIRDRLLRAGRCTGAVARLGGDEFVLLVPTTGAPAVADRILRSLRAPVAVGALELRTTASIGVADVGPGSGATLAELLTQADVAMYAAKAAGRDTVVAFHPEMRHEVARKYALTDEVRQLLGGDAAGVGRLEIHYQPLVELRSGEVVGAEALVRWRHPSHGLLAPDVFLGLVSTSGLDTRLDAAVLRDVLAQVGRWRDQGRRPLPVSVNLTRDSLADPRLADRVLAALAEAGVPPSQLHVEITEHQELPRDSPAAGSLERLLAAGVSTHLDDYGVGYTSLDYLRRFPVAVLKLDRSVIGSITDDQAQLLTGVRAMALALDLELLAEGVETSEQRAVLVGLGVRYGQGYLFSRPLPADEYAETILGPALEHVATPTPPPRLPAPRAPAEPLHERPRA